MESSSAIPHNIETIAREAERRGSDLLEVQTIVKRLTEEQRSKWAIDGYLHIEQAFSPDEVRFFSDEIDRIRQEPGWEPSPTGPLGHWAWQDHAVDQDVDGFMDRRHLLPYHQAFLDLIDRSPVFDLLVDIMGP